MSTPISLSLVEDRTIEAILPAECVAEFWTAPTDLVEIRPSAQSGLYRIVAGGKIGIAQTPHLRIVVEPKIPGVNLRAMIDPETPVVVKGNNSEEPIESVLLDALASRLSCLMISLADRGLRAVYTSEAQHSPFLAGRWDIPAQLRDPLSVDFGFHTQSDQLTNNSPVHQFPKAVAVGIARMLPEGSLACEQLHRAIQKYAAVSVDGFDPRSFAEGTPTNITDPNEQEVFEFAQLIFNGFDAREQNLGHRSTFRSLDLHLVFERFVAAGLQQFRNGFEVRVQPTLVVGTNLESDRKELITRPDLLVQVGDQTIGVVDTKWKRFDETPSASDLQQIIAYLHVTSSKFGMLVYPGEADFEKEFAISGGGKLMLKQVDVTASAKDCRESLQKLAESIRNRLRAFEV